MSTPAGPGLKSLAAATRRWQQRYWGTLRPILTLEEDGEALRVLESREEGSVRTMRLEDRLVGLAVRGQSPPTPTLKDFPGGHFDHAALRRARAQGAQR